MTKRKIKDEIIAINKQLAKDKYAVNKLNYLIRLQYKRINELLNMLD